MNLRQLGYFVKVVEAGNMTRAAEQLRIAQPALGMQVRALEEDLGVALLVRHSRGVEPTGAGELLYQRARAILELVEETRRTVKHAQGDAVEAVKMGLTPSLMQIIGPQIALALRERAPTASLSLFEDMSHVLVDQLLRGEIDVALAYEVPDTPQIARRALYQEDLVLVTLPGGKAGTPVTFAEALEEPLVLPEPRDTVRRLVTRTAEELGLALDVAHEIRSIPGMKSMILRGVAAGILPYGTVFAEAVAGRLETRLIVAPTLRRTLFLAVAAPQSGLRCLPALTAVVQEALKTLAETMGPLGHSLQPDEG